MLARPNATPELSLVVPVRDEEENLDYLYERVCESLPRLAWELLLVDDGSRDESWKRIASLAQADRRVRGARLERASGQSAAIFAGVALARAPWIATLDGDLQNDPTDLPRMLDVLHDQDLDAVVGYRVQRKDSLARRLAARLAGAVRDRVTGDRVIDAGCSLKLFRAEALRGLPRFEGMHRFLPTLLRFQGLRVAELPVSHFYRTRGRSKYGVFDRALPALLDLLAVRWMRSRRIRAAVVERMPASPD